MRKILTVTLIGAFFSVMASSAYPHCDTLDGPVIKDARTALEKEDVTPVLKWVEETNENEIEESFKKSLATRKQSPEAKELADMYFFETLVRVHRANEGAAYTGLKPAGEVEPAVAKADKAIENGSVDELASKIGTVVSSGIKKRFERLMKAKKHMNDSVEAGREYVAAYVDYVHYVEGIHNLATGGVTHQHD